MKNLKFLVLGRSNVGKSSLLNNIFGQNICQVSNYPGKTRDLFFYQASLNKRMVLIDAPGYGFAMGNNKELQQWGKMINQYFDKSKYLHRILCLIDAEHQFKKVDLMMFEMLEKKQKPFVIVLTKCDKIKNVDELFFDIKENIAKKFTMLSPIIHATSSRQNIGINELRYNIAFMLNMDLIQNFQQQIKK